MYKCACIIYYNTASSPGHSHILNIEKLGMGLGTRLYIIYIIIYLQMIVHCKPDSIYSMEWYYT